MVLLIPVGLILLFLKLLGFRKFSSFIIRYMEHGWGRIMLAAAGGRAVVTGQENIPRRGGVCFVSNHNGLLDIALLLAYSRRHIGFIAKKELLLIPVLNLWIAMVGGLFIDRNNLRKAFKTFNKGITRIKAGDAMIIFPEGHRSRGQGLLPFHPGSLKLATQAEAVIVPVAIRGTYDLYEKNKCVTPGPLRLTYCKPINTASLPTADRKQALSDQIYEVIKAALEG
jgi:1-acyl-sn-glycerol-3-phosphate acyltransferase